MARSLDCSTATPALIALAAVVAVAIVAASLLAGGATAGDAVALYEPEPQTVAAAPGETVTVDVVVRSDGGYGGEGVGSCEFVLAVPPELLAIESVEAGPFLAGDGGTVEHSTTRLEDGAVRVEQERVGADDGQTGAEAAATVTLRVREGATATNATVRIADPATHLAGDAALRIKSLTEDGTVAVDGGGDTVAPAYSGSGENASADGDVGVTTAADANRTVATDSGSDDDGEQEDAQTGEASGNVQADDSVPGFGPGAAVAALVTAALAVAASRRRS